MPIDPSPRFQSVLSALMEKFLQEKHTCGYAYHEGDSNLAASRQCFGAGGIGDV